MTTLHLRRWLLLLAGAFAGAVFYVLVEAGAREALSQQVVLILSVGLLTLSGAYLAMSGPIGPRQAGVRAGALGLAVAGLTALVQGRYDPVWDLGNAPYAALALLAVAILPVPFLIAGAGPGWRDYPALFHQGWSLAVRALVASIFTGVVWLVLWLCDALLQIVGIRLIATFLNLDPVPFVLTGAAFGLAVAVVDELSGHLSPRLVLRLLRLLLPVFVAVAAVFLAALALRGFGSAFGEVSAAATLLAMALAGVTLVAVVVDALDAEAADSPVLRRSAQAMALMLPVLAALALWALWLRVGQYGWTPGRLFLAVAGLLALAYGLAYAVATLRGAGWMARVRRANPWLAVGLIGAAALWLTPLFNAEALSARDQRARFLDGRTTVQTLDVWAISRWGLPGQVLLADLRQMAEAEGNADLLALLAGGLPPDGTTDLEALRAEVRAALPVQPASATGTRDTLVGQMEEYQLRSILLACARVLDGGAPGCVMVVADLLSASPGEEAVTALNQDGWVQIEGLFLQAGGVATRGLSNSLGRSPTADEGLALLRAWQTAPPTLAPVPIYQLGTGPEGLYFLP